MFLIFERRKEKKTDIKTVHKLLVVGKGEGVE